MKNLFSFFALFFFSCASTVDVERAVRPAAGAGGQGGPAVALAFIEQDPRSRRLLS